ESLQEPRRWRRLGKLLEKRRDLFLHPGGRFMTAILRVGLTDAKGPQGPSQPLQRVLAVSLHDVRRGGWYPLLRNYHGRLPEGAPSIFGPRVRLGGRGCAFRWVAGGPGTRVRHSQAAVGVGNPVGPSPGNRSGCKSSPPRLLQPQTPFGWWERQRCARQGR